jgi:hypothetical protein
VGINYYSTLNREQQKVLCATQPTNQYSLVSLAERCVFPTSVDNLQFNYSIALVELSVVNFCQDAKAEKSTITFNLLRDMYKDSNFKQ